MLKSSGPVLIFFVIIEKKQIQQKEVLQDLKIKITLLKILYLNLISS